MQPVIEINCSFDSDDDTTETDVYMEGLTKVIRQDVKEQVDELTSLLDGLSVEKTKLKNHLEAEQMANRSLQEANLHLQDTVQTSQKALGLLADTDSDGSGNSKKRDRSSRHRASLSMNDLSNVAERIPLAYRHRRKESLAGPLPLPRSGMLKPMASCSDFCQRSRGEPSNSSEQSNSNSISELGRLLPPAQYNLNVAVNLEEEETSDVLDIDETPVYRSLAFLPNNLQACTSIPSSPSQRKTGLSSGLNSPMKSDSFFSSSQSESVVFRDNGASEEELAQAQVDELSARVKEAVEEKESLERRLALVLQERKMLEETNRALRSALDDMEVEVSDSTLATKKLRKAANATL